MTTFKVPTKTQINYCLNLNGNMFAVRKNNRGFWMSVSYKEYMVSTDNYICKVLDGYATKKEAVAALVNRAMEAPKGFFHNI